MHVELDLLLAFLAITKLAIEEVDVVLPVLAIRLVGPTS
jgi:hypothetical protein